MYYILAPDGRTVLEEPDMDRHLTWRSETHIKHLIVAKHYIFGKVEVSTVFVGVSPDIFRTDVFRHQDRRDAAEFITEIDEQYTRRYSTWEDAEQGHRDIVRLVTQELIGIRREVC